MQNGLNILHLEDDRLDADLIRDTLTSQGIIANILAVETEVDFRASLLNGDIDLVLSDYSPPGFSGMGALRVVREFNEELPFIFVSGTIGEEIAIESLKSGATDYVLKQGLQRLGLSVQRALSEVKELEKSRREDEADITERKRVEEARQSSEIRYERVLERNIQELKVVQEAASKLAAIVESSNDAIVGKTLDGIITSWNQGAERLYGYSAEEVVGRSIAILALPEHSDEVPAILERLRQGESIDHFETERMAKDRKRIFVSLTISPIREESGAISGFSTIARDITERKQAEEARQSSELRYRRLFESAKDGILILDADSGQIIDVNPYLVEMLGFSAEELAGRELWEIGAFKDIVASKLAFEELQQRGYIRYDNLPLKSREGLVRQVEFVSNSYLAGESPVIHCNIRDITARKLAEEELRQTNQHLEGALAQLQTKTHELASMTQQLWQASKLAMMGELAASIAHELNNPLATVALRAEALIEELTLDDPKFHSAKIISQEVERMASLVGNLLKFSRRRQPAISTLDLREELRNSLELIEYYLSSHNVDVVRDFASVLPSVHADRQQLRQVFLNLITNASDAMPQGGSLTLRAFSGVLSARPAVVVEFSDNGIGVKTGDLPKLWEPFFTTKPEGKGTGLGLAICRRTVEEHHGTIDIETSPGKGATVRITLPAADTGDNGA